MNLETGRICPFCGEAIKPAAKLCPRCRQWLTLRSLRNPAVSFWVMGVPFFLLFIGIGLAVLTKIERTFYPAPYYTDFPDSLRVIESRMDLIETSNGLRIYITGILTNQSPLAWK